MLVCLIDVTQKEGLDVTGLDCYVLEAAAAVML